MRRRGLTLLEVAVAAGLLVSLFLLASALASSAGRQGEQVDARSELLESALVLQESLAWDLHRSTGLEVLPPEDATPGVALDELVLPLAAGYDPADTPARRVRPVRYRFANGTVLRGEEPLVGGGLDRVEFAWTTTEPRELQVILRGGKDGFAFRLPAPGGGDGGLLWRRAAHHVGARTP